MFRGKSSFYLLPVVLFVYLVLSETVERSMYTDGVAYAGLAKNLANGIGSFWTPSLSRVHLTEFHSHPPLVFWLQSLFFRVFGAGIATERIYAVTVFLLSAGMMVLLWREALRGLPSLQRQWFVPLTLWLANEIVYHYYPANVLEPTMTLFALAAVYSMLRGLRPGTGAGTQFATAAAAGACVVAATLCKGFVALFPLATYAIYWLIFRDISFRRAVALTGTVIAAIGLAYLLLWQYAPARAALWDYLEIQVLPSLQSERVWEPHFRSSRWYIIKRLFAVLLPSFLVTALVFGVGRRFGRGSVTNATSLRYAFLFLSLGVAASFPLAISPKQSFYYLLPSMGFYALGFASFVGPAVSGLMQLPTGRRWSWLLPLGFLLLLLGGVLNTYRHWGKINNRDRLVLHDIARMQPLLPEGTTVGSRGDIAELVSYFYRNHRVSIDTNSLRALEYDWLITRQDQPIPPHRTPVVEGERYVLYRLTDDEVGH